MASWQAGALLARTIFTYVDLNNDGHVDGNHSLDSNEFISFHIPPTNMAKLTSYLDLADDTAFSLLGYYKSNSSL